MSEMKSVVEAVMDDNHRLKGDFIHKTFKVNNYYSSNYYNFSDKNFVIHVQWLCVCA